MVFLPHPVETAPAWLLASAVTGVGELWCAVIAATDGLLLLLLLLDNPRHLNVGRPSPPYSHQPRDKMPSSINQPMVYFI